MHVVYLVTNLNYVSGGIRVVTEHANGLVARGHNVELWVHGESLTPYFNCRATVKKFDTNQLSTPDVVVIADTAFLAVTMQFREDKPTYVLLQHDTEWLAEISDIPSFMYHIKDNRHLFTKGVWGTISVSPLIQEMALQNYGLKSHLIPNAVNHMLFKPAKPLLDLSAPTVLLYYDPQPWKGFIEAATAALQVKQVHANLQILILGGVLLEGDNTVSRHFPFPAFYCNFPEQKYLAKIYSSATVFVSASWKEGFGLPGLEAMACGTPLVTTEAGGNSMYAVPDETAVVVRPKDIQALTDGILRVLENKGLRDKLVKNGLKKAAEFQWEQSIDKLEAIFGGIGTPQDN